MPTYKEKLEKKLKEALDYYGFEYKKKSQKGMIYFLDAPEFQIVKLDRKIFMIGTKKAKVEFLIKDEEAFEIVILQLIDLVEDTVETSTNGEEYLPKYPFESQINHSMVKSLMGDLESHPDYLDVNFLLSKDEQELQVEKKYIETEQK